MERRSLETAMEDIGLMLFTYRLYRKKKLDGMAKAVSIAPSTLVRIESGLYPRVTVGIIAELCDHYKIPLTIVFEAF